MKPSTLLLRAGGVAALATVGGVGLYLTRRLLVPSHQREIAVTDVPSTPHELSPAILKMKPPAQLLSEGVGQLFHRRYHVDIRAPKLSPQKLIQRITSDINYCSPTEVANFEKVKGGAKRLAVGDEYFIHLTGPWNGPVRVIEVKPTSFSFITLQGHLEAGEIQFRVISHPSQRGVMRFEIRSWSRSKDKVVDFAYETVPVVKTAQTQMWVYFCQQVVGLSGGEQAGEIEVTTEKTDYKAPSPRQRAKKGKSPVWHQYESRLNELRSANLNYDLTQRETFTKVNGWNLDQSKIVLPSEGKGDPERNGSWELAKAVLYNYEFPDPSLIQGIFIPDDPLEKRVMVLKAQFLLFSFYFGVRISGVVDEVREEAGRGKARVWGYSYQTLEGHWEMGEIFFELWKFLDSGEVEFRIHSYSKTGLIRNPIYRLGFWMFGRRLQRRFARQALKRTLKFVETRLEEGKRAQPLEKPEVLSTSEDSKAEAAAEQA